MPTGAPEFVMPPAAPTAHAGPTEPAPRGAAPTAAELDDAAPLTAAREPRRFARTLLAVGAVGVVVGAVGQAAVLAVADARADARTAEVESVAMDYLTAIAEGRAADATAMVPPALRGEVAPDAVLAGAAAIHDYGATVVGSVEGDAALVLVDYTVGGVDAERLLDVQATDGRWQIVTSLAEPPRVYQEHGTATAVLSGVELQPIQPMLLYPGAYRPDVIDSGLYRTVGSPFVVDGDPATPSDVWSGLEVDMETGVTARGLALATVEACQAAGTCGIPADAAVFALEDSRLVALDAETGGITLGETIAFGDRWVEVRIRAIRDAETGLTRWFCPGPERLELPSEPCGR
jgi:hypothetical protein